MRNLSVLILCAGLAMTMAACNETGTDASPSEKAEPQPMLGTVPLNATLRALGTEPFWSLDITPAGLTVKELEKAEVTAGNNGPKVTGNVAVWTSTLSDKRPLEVTLMLTDCSDGMSDRTYPLTSMVKLGDATLMGCAATLEALERAGESGRVE